jgi:hypothetical protein
MNSHTFIENTPSPEGCQELLLTVFGNARSGWISDRTPEIIAVSARKATFTARTHVYHPPMLQMIAPASL